VKKKSTNTKSFSTASDQGRTLPKRAKSVIFWTDKHTEAETDATDRTHFIRRRIEGGPMIVEKSPRNKTDRQQY